MISYENLGNRLNVSYINEKGNAVCIEIPIPSSEMYSWSRCRKADQFENCVTWDDKPVKKVPCKLLSKERANEFLHHGIEKETQDLIFNYDNMPKIYFVDIETEVLDGFPDKNNPINKILTISIVDENRQCIVLGLKDLSSVQQGEIKSGMDKYLSKYNLDINFKYLKFNSERDLLYTFLSKYAKRMTAITGWNFVDFDWDYIAARSTMVGVNVKESSITGGVDHNNLPYHKIIFDYLGIYRSPWAKLPNKDSFKLDYIAEHALGVKKIAFEGGFDDLYNNDFQKFVMYNAVDSLLVLLLHENYNAFSAYFKQAQLSHIHNINQMSSISLLEAVILRFLYDRNVRPVREKNNNKFRNITGGYVAEPHVGFYNFVATYDYASLYPSIIRQFNISPDAYLGQKDDVSKDIQDVSVVCENDAVFRNDMDGFYKIILTDIYNQRKEEKKKMDECEDEINKLKQEKNRRI